MAQVFLCPNQNRLLLHGHVDDFSCQSSISAMHKFCCSQALCLRCCRAGHEMSIKSADSSEIVKLCPLTNNLIHIFSIVTMTFSLTALNIDVSLSFYKFMEYSRTQQPLLKRLLINITYPTINFNFIISFCEKKQTTVCNSYFGRYSYYSYLNYTRHVYFLAVLNSDQLKELCLLVWWGESPLHTCCISPFQYCTWGFSDVEQNIRDRTSQNLVSETDSPLSFLCINSTMLDVACISLCVGGEYFEFLYSIS